MDSLSSSSPPLGSIAPSPVKDHQPSTPGAVRYRHLDISRVPPPALQDVEREIAEIQKKLAELMNTPQHSSRQAHEIHKLVSAAANLSARADTPEEVRRVKQLSSTILTGVKELIVETPLSPLERRMRFIEHSIKDLKAQKRAVENEPFKPQLLSHKTRTGRAANLQKNIEALESEYTGITNILKDRDKCLQKISQNLSARNEIEEQLFPIRDRFNVLENKIYSKDPKLSNQELQESRQELEGLRKVIDELTGGLEDAKTHSSSLGQELMTLEAKLYSNLENEVIIDPAFSIIPEGVEFAASAYSQRAVQMKLADPASGISLKTEVEGIPIAKQSLKDIGRSGYSISDTVKKPNDGPERPQFANATAPIQFRNAEELFTSLKQAGVKEKDLEHVTNFCSQALASDTTTLATATLYPPQPNGDPSPYQLHNKNTHADMVYNIIIKNEQVIAIEAFTRYEIRDPHKPQPPEVEESTFLADDLCGVARVDFEKNPDGTIDYTKGDEIVHLWWEERLV